MMSTGYHLLGNPKPPSHNLRFLAQYPLPLHHRYRKGFQSLDPQTGQGVFRLSDQLDYRVPVFRGLPRILFPSSFPVTNWLSNIIILLTLSWVWISVAAWDALYDHHGGGSSGRVITGDITVLHLSPSLSFFPFAYMSHLSLLCQCIIIITARAFDNPYNIYWGCTFARHRWFVLEQFRPQPWTRDWSGPVPPRMNRAKYSIYSHRKGHQTHGSTRQDWVPDEYYRGIKQLGTYGELRHVVENNQ